MGFPLLGLLVSLTCTNGIYSPIWPSYPTPFLIFLVWRSLVFKIEVFNALQTWFGTSKYTSLKTTLQNATPNWKWRRHLKSSIQSAHHKNQQAESIVTTRSRVRWLILGFSHYIVLETCTIQFMHKSNTSTSILCSWIDVLDLNRPFNWRAEIWEPFEMKFMWGLQAWALAPSITNILSP